MGEEAQTGDPRAAWHAIRSELERSLPAATFDLWIAPLDVVSSQAGTLYLTAPKRVRTWVERRYTGALEEALGRAGTGLTRIGFLDTKPNQAGAAAPSKRVAEPMPVDSTHEFSRFVIGPSNRFAHAAALAVAEAPGEAYNPLYLHGPPGLGKTHLMGAIAGYMRENHPELTVHYTTAERFTSEFVTTLRSEGPERFKRRYRGLDALLIDDIQFLEGKKSTEEEFFNTFNALHSAGKQIVLSSDRSPEALSDLAERLRDRFAWGLTVEIEPPDMRTRTALLWRFASDAVDGLPDPAALREIASRVPGNVRRLEGALTRVLAVASVFDEPLGDGAIDRALAKPSEALAASSPGSVKAPTITAIQEAVASVIGVPPHDLLSASRTAKVVRARHLAMYLARELTPLSLVQIAKAFQRDHSTVVSAIRSVQAKSEPGSPIARDIHSARAALGDIDPDRLPTKDSIPKPPSRPQD